jgi:hypothetical protein
MKTDYSFHLALTLNLLSDRTTELASLHFCSKNNKEL